MHANLMRASRDRLGLDYFVAAGITRLWPFRPGSAGIPAGANVLNEPAGRDAGAPREKRPQPPHVRCYDTSETSLRQFAPGMQGPTHILFPDAHERAFHPERLFWHRAIRQQKIFFPNYAARELLRQRPVGQPRFAKDDYPGCLLIEPMNDRQVCPARFAVSQPVVNALAGKRIR